MIPIDVLILAGGAGARLHGIWHAAKCMIPVAGQPLLVHVLEKLRPVSVRRAFVLLGVDSRAQQVAAFLRTQRTAVPCGVIHQAPCGTASAVRNALPQVAGPLLVLNGDTLPIFNFASLVQVADLAAEAICCAWSHDRFAGAAVFQSRAIDELSESSQSSLDFWTNRTQGVLRHHVHDYIDAGTPHGFQMAVNYSPEKHA